MTAKRQAKSWLSDVTGIDANLGTGTVTAGKNSIWDKPFGVGNQSVSSNPLNLNPIHSGTIGSGPGIYGGNTLSGAVFGGGNRNPSMSQLSAGDVEKFLQKGEQKGEALTGATMEEAGKGRADVRKKLTGILAGNSAGASSLRQDQMQQQKSLKAQQALAGGGQMNAGQQQALKRQADIDYAKFVSAEKRQALADLSREWRGVGGDNMRASGQYGSILVGAQPPAKASSGGGFLSAIFG